MASDKPSPNQTGEPSRPAPTPAPPAAPPKAFATESTEKALKDSPVPFATEMGLRETVLGMGFRPISASPTPQPKPPPQPPGPFETDRLKRGKKGGGK